MILTNGLVVLFAQFINPDKKSPNNYRGNTFSNCLGKLFNAVLYDQIKEKLENKIVISQTQTEFCKTFRTTNHSYTLFNLIKTHIKKGQYLYTCFVRFFQNIWFCLERRFDAQFRKYKDYMKESEGRR